jgi:Pyruvate/2-oxoacid:ferredoxin oxidoreductase delta subunit
LHSFQVDAAVEALDTKATSHFISANVFQNRCNGGEICMRLCAQRGEANVG